MKQRRRGRAPFLDCQADGPWIVILEGGGRPLQWGREGKVHIIMDNALKTSSWCGEAVKNNWQSRYWDI